MQPVAAVPPWSEMYTAETVSKGDKLIKYVYAELADMNGGKKV